MNKVIVWMEDGQVIEILRVTQVEVIPNLSVWIEGNVDPMKFGLKELVKVDILKTV